VSKLLGHHLGCNPDRESKSGRCVAEIVEPDVRQACFSQEWFEMQYSSLVGPPRVVVKIRSANTESHAASASLTRLSASGVAQAPTFAI
jgi:hypothetical protein